MRLWAGQGSARQETILLQRSAEWLTEHSDLYISSKFRCMIPTKQMRKLKLRGSK